MPIYEYRCTNAHTFEVMQSMTDDPVTSCTQCGAPVERLFHPVAVHFKGSGFYSTDYGRKRSSPDSGGNGKSETKETAATAKSDSGDAGQSASGSSGSGSGSAGSGSGGSSGD